MPIDKDLLNKLAQDNFEKEDLDLSNSNLNDEDICELVSALSGNTSVRFLNLNSNKIGFLGAQKLSELANILKLSISYNPLEDEGAIALAKSKSIKELWVHGCGIQIKGAEAFIHNKVLHDLHINRNKFDQSDNDWLDRIAKRLNENIAKHDPIYKREVEAKKVREAQEANISKAMIEEDLEELGNLIKSYGINTRMEYGCELLLYAIDEDLVDVAEFLLKSGARLEDHEREYTSLFHAAENGQLDMVELLLKYGANISGEFYFNEETVFSVSAFKFCATFIMLLSKINLSMDMPNYIDECANEQYQAEIDRISEFWNRLSNVGPSYGILFGRSENLSYNFTLSCLELFQSLSKYLITIDKYKELLNELNERADLYLHVLKKINILKEKAPSTELDKLATDDEGDDDLTHKIEFLRKEDSQAVPLTRAELEQWVSQLNQELKGKTESEIDWSKYPKFFIAQYRGIHYYRKHFTKAQRADHRHTLHLNRIAPAPAVYYMSNLSPIQHQLARESVIRQNKAIVVDTFDQFAASDGVEEYWSNKGKTFENESDMLQQRMSNTYGPYREDIEQQVHPVTKLLYERRIIGYPHYATSDLPYHALKYAYGQKRVDGLIEWRLRPMFQENGKPLHPYPGKIYIAMFNPLQMHFHKTRHVAGKHNRRKINLLSTVAPERETSPVGGVEPEVPYYEETLQIPSFENYQDDYEQKYGLTLELFTKFKQQIAESWTNPDLKERDRLRRKVKNDLILKVLMPHKQKQLLIEAQHEARRRGGYLIYRHYDGVYGVDPEGMRIPSKGKRFYSNQEKELLREVGELRFCNRPLNRMINLSRLNEEAIDNENPINNSGSKRKKVERPATDRSVPKKQKIGYFNDTREINEADWYSQEQVKALLHFYLNDQNNVEIFDAISGTQLDGSTLATNLWDNIMQRVLKYSQGHQPNRISIIPLNLNGNHWSLLIIRHNENHVTAPNIIYIDPFGEYPPDTVHEAVLKVYHEANFQTSETPFQNDGVNCGPWIVAFAEYYVQHNSLPPFDWAIDISARREQDEQILAAQFNQQGDSSINALDYPAITPKEEEKKVKHTLKGLLPQTFMPPSAKSTTQTREQTEQESPLLEQDKQFQNKL